MNGTEHGADEDLNMIEARARVLLENLWKLIHKFDESLGEDEEVHR